MIASNSVAAQVPTTRPTPVSRQQDPTVQSKGKRSPPKQRSTSLWSELTFDQTIVQATKLQRMIFLNMYAEWCGSCRRMEAAVFGKPEVLSYLQRYFISLRRDGFRGEGVALARRYNCVTYPCMLIIDGKGQEIERLTSYTPSAEFMQRLEDFRQNKGTLADLEGQLSRQPQDAVLRFRVGFRYAYRGDRRSVEHLMYVSKNPPTRYPWLAARSLYVLARIYFYNTLRDCRETVRVLDLYLKHPPSPNRSRALDIYKHCQNKLSMKNKKQ
jgi:thiol-disulfide isomerase/thioredoxin